MTADLKPCPFCSICGEYHFSPPWCGGTPTYTEPKSSPLPTDTSPPTCRVCGRVVFRRYLPSFKGGNDAPPGWMHHDDGTDLCGPSPLPADLRAQVLAICERITEHFGNKTPASAAWKVTLEMARALAARLAEPTAPLPEIGWMQGDPLTVEQLRWVREARARLAEPSDRQVELEDCDHPCVRCGAEQAEPLCVDCLAEPSAQVADASECRDYPHCDPIATGDPCAGCLRIAHPTAAPERRAGYANRSTSASEEPNSQAILDGCPSDEEVARWRMFSEDAFVATNEDGEVVVGAYLAEDVGSLEGATEDERAELNGDKPRSFGRVIGAGAVTRLWDAAVNAARERARKT